MAAAAHRLPLLALNIILNMMDIVGYSSLDNPRSEGRGGGVATVYHQDFETTPLSIPAAPSFEDLSFKLPGPKPLIISIIYRPPKPNPSFLPDLSEFITALSSISPSVLLICDFNLHIVKTLWTSWTYSTALASPKTSTFPPTTVGTS